MFFFTLLTNHERLLGALNSCKKKLAAPSPIVYIKMTIIPANTAEFRVFWYPHIAHYRDYPPGYGTSLFRPSVLIFTVLTFVCVH